MKYYKAMCLVVAIDVALFFLISLFFRPHSGTTAFTLMKYSFFVPLIVVCVLQLASLLLNILQGHVNTIGATRFVVYTHEKSPPLFFFGIAWELTLWILPMYAIYKFLAEAN